MNTRIQLAYLAAAVLFILGLRMLSSPKTAPRGNVTAGVGMFIAIVATPRPPRSRAPAPPPEARPSARTAIAVGSLSPCGQT